MSKIEFILGMSIILLSVILIIINIFSKNESTSFQKTLSSKTSKAHRLSDSAFMKENRFFMIGLIILIVLIFAINKI